MTAAPSTDIRLPDALLAQLDAWIAAQPQPHPSRAAAIARLLADALAQHADAGSIPVEELNANNDE